MDLIDHEFVSNISIVIISYLIFINLSKFLKIGLMVEFIVIHVLIL